MSEELKFNNEQELSNISFCSFYFDLHLNFWKL